MDTSKELFIKAFMEAERLDHLHLKSEEEIDWDFSDEFEHSMDKLIKKNNRIKLSTRRSIRKGLLAAIIAILILFTGLMSVSATRTPFIEFIKRVFPQFNEITLSEESTPPVDIIETEYTLTALPEGYVLDIYQRDEISVFSVWKNESGEEIVFSQNILNSNISIDTESSYEETYVNGFKAYLNTYEYNSVLNWSDNQYWFILNVPNDSEADIISIAENISEKN